MATLMSRNRVAAVAALTLVAVGVGAVAFLVRQTWFAPKTISAYFTSVTAIYPGDDVRVSGVKVGHIVSIQPQGTQDKMVMTLDRDVPVPADTNAVIVAENLVSARYVQLTTHPRPTAPVINDGAVIPLGRTAVPVEWDEVKEQINRLATDLGPSSDVSSTAVGRFIDSAANAMSGNGDKLRQTLSQLSGVGRILANGSGNIVDTIKNLQTFVTALRDSNVQIVQFQDRLASLTGVLNDSRSDLDAALTNLSQAVGDVKGFIAQTRDKTSEQIQRLAAVTQNLVDHRMDLEQVLHTAPNGIANAYMVDDPQTGGGNAVLTLNNLSNPEHLICGAIAAVADVTSAETSKLCSQYLGPGLRLPTVNELPIPLNPLLERTPPPQDLIYTDPKLMPGVPKQDPSPPETLPAVSAYQGFTEAAPGAAGSPPPKDLRGLLLPPQAAPAGGESGPAPASAAPAQEPPSNETPP